MSVDSSAGPDRREAVTGMLRVTLWVLLAGACVGFVLTADQSQTGMAASLRGLLIVTMIGLGIALTIATAIIRPEQRAALTSLAVALTLWGGGSMLITTTTRPETPTLSSAEWLFLSSYLGFAAFLLLDGRRRTDLSSALLVEVIVLTGGVGSTAGILVFLPISRVVGGAGLALLVALAYPLADVLLVLVVVAQVGLGRRPASVRTAMILGSLVLLTIADAAFAQRLAAGRYQFQVWVVAVWTVAAVLLVQGAVLPREPEIAHRSPRRRGLILLPAVAAALLALALPVEPWVAPYLKLPALVTLMAVAARLILALREAHQATEAYRLSLVDDLTGLPNRRAVLDALDHAARPTAVALLEVESVKDINYSLGYAAGDHVLQALGARLVALAPPNSVVGRVEGPMFAILLTNPKGSQQALDTARGLRNLLADPVSVAGLDLSMRVLAGLALSTDQQTGGELLRQAHVAVRQARESADGVVLFDAAEDLSARARLAQNEEVRRALAAGELTVWYQPQVAAATLQLTGVEALVRWEHPREGVRGPAAFLPAARRAGLMAQVTEMVARQAATDALRWSQEGRPLRVSINVSPPEVASGTIVPLVTSLLDELALDPELLVIEVTEESLLEDPATARIQLDALRAQRVAVSVDDYGTGFSSLSYLRDLHVDELKIDRSFISELGGDERSRMIVASTIAMSHALGARVVAEGVETPQAASALVAMGVDTLQGYHIAPPMPHSVLAAWARDWTAGVGLPAALVRNSTNRRSDTGSAP